MSATGRILAACAMAMSDGTVDKGAPLDQGDGVTRGPNTRAALAVSVGTRASRVTPRARASANTVSRTNAGSLRLPRCGTGARYGASVSTSRRSAGHTVRYSGCPQLLNVIIP